MEGLRQVVLSCLDVVLHLCRCDMRSQPGLQSIVRRAVLLQVSLICSPLISNAFPLSVNVSTKAMISSPMHSYVLYVADQKLTMDSKLEEYQDAKRTLKMTKTSSRVLKY
jgi:hypothetical protein